MAGRNWRPPNFNGNNNDFDEPECTWHKIQVHGELRWKDRGLVLKQLKHALGYHFRAVVYKKQNADDASFYVNDFETAERISNVVLDNGTFELFPNEDPPIVPPCPALILQLRKALKKLLSNDGVLNLSNFALYNILSLDFFLPLNKEKVRNMVDKTISDWQNLDQIITVDLSKNGLSSFDGFRFLTAAKNIKVLVADNNYAREKWTCSFALRCNFRFFTAKRNIEITKFRTLTVLDPLRTMSLRELSLQYNRIGEQFQIGGRDRNAYVDDIRELFPYMTMLDGEKIRPRKRFAENRWEEQGRGSPNTPAKFPRRLAQTFPRKRGFRKPQYSRHERNEEEMKDNVSVNDDWDHSITIVNSNNCNKSGNVQDTPGSSHKPESECHRITIPNDTAEEKKHGEASSSTSTPIQYSEDGEKMAIRVSRLEAQVKESNEKIGRMSQLIEGLLDRNEESAKEIRHLKQENANFKKELDKIREDIYSDNEGGTDDVSTVVVGDEYNRERLSSPSTSQHNESASGSGAVDTNNTNPHDHKSTAYVDLEDLFERPKRD